MASRPCSSNGGSRRWQRSLDSQDFGFASNLLDSSDVAPADELFFNGLLLPLLRDPATDLAQPLCCPLSAEDEQALLSSIATARLESCRFPVQSSRLEEDAIEFNSCVFEQEASLEHLTAAESRQGVESIDGVLLSHHCLQNCSESSCMEGSEELQTFSHDLAMASCRKDKGSDGITGLRSSSFRSQNSGFWDSGTDKDLIDSSSSSRDSNGSLQDSYLNPNFVPSSKAYPDHRHGRPILSFGIANWRSGISKRGACRKGAASQNPPAPAVFSDELGDYKDSAAPPSPEVEAALLPWKHQTQTSVKSDIKQINPRVRMPTSAEFVGKMTISSRSAAQEAGARKLTLSQERSTIAKSICAVMEGAAEIGDGARAKNRRSVSARRRWHICAKKLKPLREMKEWMGQFGMMDDCGKRAYFEVEHGTILLHSARNPAADGHFVMQRRSSRQANSDKFALKGHGSSLPQQKQANTQSFKKKPAMASCPSSTISSPHHSGVLDFLDPIPKLTNSLKPANSAKSQGKVLSSLPLKNQLNLCDAAPGSMKSSRSSSIHCSGVPLNDCLINNHRSMSTMQELQTSLQSAIAHCKESNKKLIMDAD